MLTQAQQFDKQIAAYRDWKAAVNRHILNMPCGLDADDLPVWDYWSAWNDGVSPRNYAAMLAWNLRGFSC